MPPASPPAAKPNTARRKGQMSPGKPGLGGRRRNPPVSPRWQVSRLGPGSPPPAALGSALLPFPPAPSPGEHLQLTQTVNRT